MDNKTARQDLETVIRVEDLALGSMRKLRAIQDWLRAEAAPIVWIDPVNLKRTMIAAPGETVEVSAYREGEFTAPLYTHPPAKVPEDVQEIIEQRDVFKAQAAEYQKAYEAVLTTPTPATTPEAESFQSRVQPWLLECFGAMIAGDKEERNHRFLEEALELVQACDCTADEAHKLVDYVFSRPVGERYQEVGGVHVTLAALCLAQDIDGQAAAEAELSRITQPEMVGRIREKQKRKPSMSPLPGVYPERPSAPADKGAE